MDLSEEMLTVASQKTMDMDRPPRFVCQSLQKLWLPRAVDLAVCALDSLDYVTDPEDCQEAIRRVYRALNPGGIFIFDVNTPKAPGYGRPDLSRRGRRCLLRLAWRI